MKTVIVKDFSKGMADDRFNASPGEFSIAKHFDVLTNPQRLQPLRGMTTHTASTGIGNIIVASNGQMYGVGLNALSASSGKLWYLTGYGASDDWGPGSGIAQTGGSAVEYDFLVEYPGAGNAKTVFWAVDDLLLVSSLTGAGSADSQSLTFSTIGQGFVHPKDNILYFPYRTATTPYIATIGSNATSFGTYNPTAFTLPSQYRVYCLTNWGNYLAIPATSVTSLSNINSSIVYLSDRDTSQTTFAESIPWGAGALKVLNNLGGALIGISETGSDTIQAETTQDFNSIQIKVWNGGAEPTLIKEIKTFHFAGSSRPSVTINNRVNFIHKNRLYFSVNVNPNDGSSASYYGLWSVGKSKTTGEWVVTLERMATNDGSETSVIAAAMAGDFVAMAHTAVGTLTRTTQGVTSASTYGATSVYESIVNPEMPESDQIAKKNLVAVGVKTLPLLSGQQVVMKVRVDSSGSSSDWKTIFTKTSSTPDTDTVSYETPILASMSVADGCNFEFRLESTGGAVITSFGYKYQPLPNQIL